MKTRGLLNFIKTHRNLPRPRDERNSSFDPGVSNPNGFKNRLKLWIQGKQKIYVTVTGYKILLAIDLDITQF